MPAPLATTTALLARALCEFFASDAPLANAESPERFRATMLQRSSSSSDSASSDGDLHTASDDGKHPEHFEHITVDVVLATFAPAAYVDQLATVVSMWHASRQNPMLQLPTAVDGVVETATCREMLLHLSIEVVDAFVASVTAVEVTTTRIESCATFIAQIGGARGVLTLLGFRQTVGSRDVGPLTRTQCLDAFTQRRGRATLTVGARAFTKHCGRSADGWWGSLAGNDEAKNRVALRKLAQILDNAVWKNVHSLPHAHVTLEVRNALGFGARWTVDDGAFRGFLEPQMRDGHASRWRH